MYFQPSNVLLTLNGHLKLTDFGLAGSIVKYKRNDRQNITSDVSKLKLDPNLVVAMSAAKHDEPTGSTDDIMSESSTQTEPEMSNQETNEQNNVKWVRRRTVCGTAGYRPPEQVQERYLDYFSRNGYDERADWFSLGVCCFTMITGRRPFPTKKELLQSDCQHNLVDGVEGEGIPSKTNFDSEAKKRLMNDAEYRCLLFEVIFPSSFDEEPEAKSFIELLLARNPEERPRYEGIISHPWFRGEKFVAKEVVKRSVPGWVKDHAYLQSIRNDQLRGNQRLSYRISQRSLTECIESLCSDCFEKYGGTYAQNFVVKWSTLAGARTIQLFRHWNYMSDDVIALESKALSKKENEKKNPKNQSVSGRLSEVFSYNSSSPSCKSRT